MAQTPGWLAGISGESGALLWVRPRRLNHTGAALLLGVPVVALGLMVMVAMMMLLAGEGRAGEHHQ